MRKYADWKLSTEISDARFTETCTKVSVQLSSEWVDIGDGWKLKAECNPEVNIWGIKNVFRMSI